MNKCLLSVITNDDEVVEGLRELMGLFPNWEMRVYTNVDKAWIEYLTREPELSIVDLDYTGIDPDREAANMMREGSITPVILFVSSQARSSLHATYSVEMNALDYVQKPVSLDRIVFALSIVQGPPSPPDALDKTSAASL